MSKKQKKVLYRIIISLVLLVVISVLTMFVEIPAVLEFILYMVPYFVTAMIF